MKRLVWAFLAVSLPAAYAAPIYITVSFIGAGSVGGIGFSGQTVTVTATADTTNITFPSGASRPTYAPDSLTIAVPGFGTGAATNLSLVRISNQEGQGSGAFSLSVQPFVYLALTNAAFSTWNLTTSIGPVAISGDSTQGFVQLPNNDVWGATGIPTSIGTVKVTYAENVIVTASLSTPAPVTVFSPAQGATGVTLPVTLTWAPAGGALSYDVYFGTSASPPFLGNTTATTYSPAVYNLNTTYYWYLVSKNAAGNTASAVWSFTTVAGAHPSFFSGEAYLGSGGYFLQFLNGNIFGYYNYQYFPVLYHYDLGFEYILDASDGNSGAYFYDFTSGHWFYTSPTYGFPYLYDFTLQAALYYYPDANNPGHYTTNPRYFYNFLTGTIITM